MKNLVPLSHTVKPACPNTNVFTLYAPNKKRTKQFIWIAFKLFICKNPNQNETKKNVAKLRIQIKNSTHKMNEYGNSKATREKIKEEAHQKKNTVAIVIQCSARQN